MTTAGTGQLSGSAWMKCATRRAEPPQQARHRHRHAQLLRAGRQMDRLDAVGDESRVAGHRRDSQIVRHVRQLTEQLHDVRLVAGASPAEHVRVDEHQGLVAHAAASRYTCTVAAATASQRN